MTRSKQGARPVILAAAVLLSVGTGALHVASVRPAAAAPAALPAEADPTTVINQLIEQRWKEKNATPAALCNDRAFARRVYLDLIGRIPTTAEVDAFAAAAGKEKRAALVDRLLASPEYARRMRDVFDVVFIGRPREGSPRRRGQENAKFRGEWLTYLERSFAGNRPWDRMLRDMLLARPATAEERGAVWFLFARQDKYQEIAEAVSPAVFGVQVQCAQCHDHPLVDEIKQAHYWGLVAFFNRGKNRLTKEGPHIAESAIGGFSNFDNLSGQSSPAQLTFLGVDPLPEERPEEGQMPQDAPEFYRPAEGNSDAPKVPKFSRREQFVERVVQGNPLVARAAVNRFWALLMGRGMVHPVDQMDSIHAPSHPELLDWLARDLERSRFDVKRLVRAIVLSRPYQLESRPAGDAQPDLFASSLEKPLTAEALYRSLLVASTGKTEGDDAELRESLIEIFPDVFAEENNTSLRQTMFLSNNAMVQRLVQAKEGSTVERLTAIADPAARVKEAFRIAYARDPDAEELRETVAFLTSRATRPKEATAQLWWALLAGAEFRFNH